MFARVAKWEGGDPEALRRSAAEIASQADQGPPEGVPATAFTLLIDPEAGRSIAIVMFATEEDRRVGHETLNAMNPPERRDGHARRGGVLRRGRAAHDVTVRHKSTAQLIAPAVPQKLREVTSSA